MPELEQIDAVLAEDLRTVMLYGYAGDDLYMQTVHEATSDLDPDTIETTEADTWRRMAKADQWGKM